VINSNYLSPQPPIRQEKAAVVELRKGVIQIVPVENDRSPRSLVILTGLKTLFQKQLPNMPREYIARLVYDANSKDLAIIKRGYKVVGGICYRPFPHRGFAEIVFFATASVDQEKVPFSCISQKGLLLTINRDMVQC
jgi:histone acetyltransferase